MLLLSLRVYLIQGDHAVKNVGVIPEPEVKIYDIKDNDMFMIMASDGVWEFINSQVSYAEVPIFFWNYM
jgi:serine/threonine protein phosphatase PrpC